MLCAEYDLFYMLHLNILIKLYIYIYVCTLQTRKITRLKIVAYKDYLYSQGAK